MTTDSMSSPTIQAEAAGTPSSRGVPTFPTSPVEAAPYPVSAENNPPPTPTSAKYSDRLHRARADNRAHGRAKDRGSLIVFAQRVGLVAETEEKDEAVDDDEPTWIDAMVSPFVTRDWHKDARKHWHAAEEAVTAFHVPPSKKLSVIEEAKVHLPPKAAAKSKRVVLFVVSILVVVGAFVAQLVRGHARAAAEEEARAAAAAAKASQKLAIALAVAAVVVIGVLVKRIGSKLGGANEVASPAPVKWERHRGPAGTPARLDRM